MNSSYKLLIIITLLIIGCNPRADNKTIITQSINSMDMNIFSNEGEKFLSIKSPYSNYDNDKNVFSLKETTINLFKNNKSEFIISSDKSKISNNNKLLELDGNVLIRSLIKNEEEIYSNKIIWDINNSEFLLIGNVNFKNNQISLSSNKAIFDKKNNIIEFFNPVKYTVNDMNKEKKYEVNSENAYYNINTKSVSFSSKENKVRSKIYF